MGFIDTARLEQLAARRGKGPYGTYLRALADARAFRGFTAAERATYAELLGAEPASSAR